MTSFNLDLNYLVQHGDVILIFGLVVFLLAVGYSIVEKSRKDAATGKVKQTVKDVSDGIAYRLARQLGTTLEETVEPEVRVRNMWDERTRGTALHGLLSDKRVQEIVAKAHTILALDED